MRQHRTTNRLRQPPRGFTLVEILVVISIIIFLIGMTVTVVRGVTGTARENATKATIKTIDGLLTQRMDAFTMALKTQNLTGNDWDSVMARKRLFRQHFPQTLAEAGLGTDDPNDPTASSEAMYYFLTQMESFGDVVADADSFNREQVKDTDGDGRLEFVDGWGQPLRFYRWPTRLIRPAGPGQETEPQSFDTDTGDYVFQATADFNPPPDKVGHDANLFFAALPSQSELTKDPDDPLGRINPQSVNVADFEKNFHTPETWSVPLIVSAGADGELGLYEPTNKDNFGHLAQPRVDNPSRLEGVLDNLSNRNMQP